MNNANLTLMTYNIWCKDLFSDERLTNLITLIYYYNCDVLCFQELTPYIFNKLIERISLKYPYIISTPELENDRNFGVAIFSKHKIINHFSTKLVQSPLNRYLLMTNININNQKIMVATSHLDDFENSTFKYKSNQFNQILGSLAQFDNCIFLGDTNIKNYEEDDFTFNENLWKDCWIEDGNNIEKKYTIDFKTNIFVEKNQNRQDRIYYKNKDFNLENFLVIGRDNNPTPSNHYGLFVKLKLNNIKNETTSSQPVIEYC